MQFLAPGDASTMAAEVRRGFTDRFGHDAAVVGRAPGRVNLIGEHTDYNGGRCLPLALPHATYAAARNRDDNLVQIRSATIGEEWNDRVADLPEATGWAAYVTGVLWAQAVDHGVDLLIDSSVPLGSGLSSSAALECAVAVAVDGLHDKPLDMERRRRLTDACIRAETEVAGAPTGGMDQMVSMLAPRGEALLIDFHDDTRRAVPVPLHEVGLSLLVIDTGVRHANADGSYAARRRECAAAAHLLGVDRLGRASADAWARLDDDVLRRRARHVITECERVDTVDQALVEGEWRELGQVLDASHASLAHDFEVSCPELDLAVDVARAAGALGARMTGAGFGGSAVALVDERLRGDVATSVAAAYDARGWPAPAFLAVEPAAPAGRVLGASPITAG